MTTYILSGSQPARVPAGQGIRVIARSQGQQETRVNIRAVSAGHPERPPHTVARMLANGELFVFPPPQGYETAVTISPIGATHFPPGSSVVAELVTGAASDPDPTLIQLLPISVGGFALLPLIRVVGAAGPLLVYGPTPPPPPLPPLAKSALETGREWLSRSGRPERFDKKITVVVDMSSSMKGVAEDVYAVLGIVSGVCVAVGAGSTLSCVLAAGEVQGADDIAVADVESWARKSGTGVRPVVGMPFEAALKGIDREEGNLVILISDGLPFQTVDHREVAVVCLATDSVFSLLQRSSELPGVAVEPIGPAAVATYLADEGRLRSVVGRLIDNVFALRSAV